MVSDSVKEDTVEAKPYKYTVHIKFLGVGTSEDGEFRFLKVGFGPKTALLSVRQLTKSPKDELTRLEGLGVPLIDPAAQREFVNRAQQEASRAPTFDVATRIGLHGEVFLFPDGPVPLGSGAFETYFDERQAETHRKFHVAGDQRGWEELLGNCRRNTRVICGFGLAFSGLPCAAFGLDPPGLQFVGPAGWAKSPAARIVSAVFGWDFVSRLGFGSSWNTKLSQLEVIGAACNNTLLVLDEMSQARADGVDAVMRLVQGQGTGRYTELGRLVWCTPLLSTSNVSILALVRSLRVPGDPAAYVDRLMDVPPPTGRRCFFEDLHGARTLAEYCGRMDALAEQNHGWAGREYASNFMEELNSNRARLKDNFDGRRKECLLALRQAMGGVRASGRDLSRVFERFATIYAAGRLARRFGVFPVDPAELLDAVVACARDHVAFVAGEQGAVAVVERPPGERVDGYLHRYASRFVDLRPFGARLPADHDPERCLGYIGVHDGREEDWLTNKRFEKIAGGKREADRLKSELARRGRIATDHRGAALSYVVKRHVPGFGRLYFVAIKRDAR